ncbi:hypothetical protein [Merismopedia glauca]|uniref:Uncharacterized protein n=1 Tax=Merismopedia glauca CCAP 1448/3 TaxID=1296344 RepID=A0A2T1BYA2_9CYAN|nr:hypothetical protein [Merismopedia glauca]PSB00853.1 hypothetical protein C7B64_21380 [Merismopedia glauca CCAP 1448/3]
MKSGKTLVELATEIQNQAQAKRDYIADTRTLELTDTGELVIDIEQPQVLRVTEHTHDQIAARLAIPGKYYQRMLKEAPGLLSRNVNHWFQTSPEKRMIRCLHGNARAFLSDRYRRIDHYEVLETVLPVVGEMGDGVQIVSTEITESRLYLKVINQRLELEVSKGDVVYPIQEINIKQQQQRLSFFA